MVELSMNEQPNRMFAVKCYGVNGGQGTRTRFHRSSRKLELNSATIHPQTFLPAQFA